jgi:Arc/MetJ family transcription regulator
MSVTTIDLDDELIGKAMRMHGGATKKEVVNAALRQYVELHERAKLREYYFREAEGWDFETWQRLREEEKGTQAR